MFNAFSETDSDAGPTRILVADDDPITRQLLKRYLEEKGHEVIVANDGEQAWSLFTTHNPRLVITDWRMPKLDGLGLCLRIREHQTTQYTFVLMLTSSTDREAMVQGFAAGADDFMTKPFDRGELTWRIYAGMRVLGLHASLERRIEQLDQAHAELKVANEEMHAGLTAAAKAQQALLPERAPDVRNVNCAWQYRPCDHLGGDSINLFRLSDDKIGFFVADVCGHGMAAGLLAVTLHRVLTPVAGQGGLIGQCKDSQAEVFADPGKLLTTVNQRFPMSLEDGEYFTAVYGVIDSSQGLLHYAGAGHPNPVLTSPGHPVRKLATEGFPIGFDDSTEYESETVELQPGDRLCVYSDGVVEAARIDGEMFEIDRVIEQFQNSADETPERAAKQLIKAVDTWQGTVKQNDDISLIVLEFEGKLADQPTEEVAMPDLTGVYP